MPTLQKLIAEKRELNIDELKLVAGGMLATSPMTCADYTDAGGNNHEVCNRDINSD